MAQHTENAEEISCKLLIIGGGLTGLTAALKASSEGVDTTLVAATPGSLPFTSGALDLLGVYPAETKHFRSSPWDALNDLMEREPAHPYAVMGLGAVRRAWDDVIGRLERGPLRYFRRPEQNILLVTGAGTLKPTCAVPRTMAANVTAWERRLPTLVVGFDGLTDIAPEQVVQNLGDRWPGLRSTRVDPVPLLDGPRRITPTLLCTEMENPGFREKVAQQLAPRLDDARCVGLPAVLGLRDSDAAQDHLQQLLGVEVFELPMLTPSVPGLRLMSLLEDDLRAAGVTLLKGSTVEALVSDGPLVTGARVRSGETVRMVRPDQVILASGRFLGGGMEAHRHGVTVPLLDLNLDASPSRDDWHMATFLGAPGHPINRLGVAVDRHLRPLGDDGKTPRFHNLRAAGALLAGHDWVREKSGAGVSIATGYRAVEQLKNGEGNL